VCVGAWVDGGGNDGGMMGREGRRGFFRLSFIFKESVAVFAV
jgi:hypothetical protein